MLHEAERLASQQEAEEGRHAERPDKMGSEIGANEAWEADAKEGVGEAVYCMETVRMELRQLPSSSSQAGSINIRCEPPARFSYA